jgi:thiocyanate hydrolase subunit gamma
MSGSQIANQYPFVSAPHAEHAGHAHAPSVEDDPAVIYWEQRTAALAKLLERKAILTASEIGRHVELVETITPMRGARVVARAWTDRSFKARLLQDAKSACGELGFDLKPIVHLTVLENTERVHHCVVCTLCSCYPRTLLGEPPGWYKSTAYRHRIVVEPRVVLSDAFGLDFPEETEVRVVDSTADSRFLILPRRPHGTEGWPEEDLVKLVTRDSMVGTGLPLTPAAIGR